jgi:hypothetical protein
VVPESLVACLAASGDSRIQSPEPTSRQVRISIDPQRTVYGVW